MNVVLYLIRQFLHLDDRAAGKGGSWCRFSGLWTRKKGVRDAGNPILPL